MPGSNQLLQRVMFQYLHPHFHLDAIHARVPADDRADFQAAAAAGSALGHDVTAHALSNAGS